MPSTAPSRRLFEWQAVSARELVRDTDTARSVELEWPGWTAHRAGQHIDIRLTADDGYQAVRSYSLSSGPGEAPRITVERVDDGEVSPFLVDVLEAGDTFEARGPVGGYFVLDQGDTPVLLIGGGSGIAPLRAMWRGHASHRPVTVRYSARSFSRVIFAEELAAAMFDVEVTLTRDHHDGYQTGRITREVLERAVGTGAPAETYVCGPTAFVEAISARLVELGLGPTTIRTERFG